VDKLIMQNTTVPRPDPEGTKPLQTENKPLKSPICDYSDDKWRKNHQKERMLY